MKTRRIDLTELYEDGSAERKVMRKNMHNANSPKRNAVKKLKPDYVKTLTKLIKIELKKCPLNRRRIKFKYRKQTFYGTPLAWLKESRFIFDCQHKVLSVNLNEIELL